MISTKEISCVAETYEAGGVTITYSHSVGLQDLEPLPSVSCQVTVHALQSGNCGQF